MVVSILGAGENMQTRLVLRKAAADDELLVRVMKRAVRAALAVRRDDAITTVCCLAHHLQD